MIRFRFSIILIFSCLLSMRATGQGYEIKVKINGLADKQVILGHYLSKSMYPDDTIKLDNKGYGVFKNSRKLPSGMYVMFIRSDRYFDVIIGEDQTFSLETDTVDFVNTMHVKGSRDNEIFLDFQKYMIALRVKNDSLMPLIRKESNPATKEQLTAKIKQLGNERKNKVISIQKENPDLFVSTFLMTTLDLEVPDPPKDENGHVIDSTWQYYYYRNHFFDNFNLADPRLLRTPLYEDKLMTYINKVVPQIPDSLILHADFLIEKARHDSDTYRFTLITLFNHFGKSNIMGMDALYVHIADKYYIRDSWWSDPKFLAELKDKVEKTKPLLIGSVTPDAELMIVPAAHFKSAMADTALRRYPHVGKMDHIHGIEAKYLVLLFWEADCGHCKTVVPQLHSIYKNSLEAMGVKVLAISTLFGEDGKIKWVDFVNDKGIYDWINAWNPYSYKFKMDYDVVTTPQIYILDKDKKILAKKIGPEQVEEIITAFERR